MARVIETTKASARIMLHGSPGQGALDYMARERDTLRDRMSTGSLVLRGSAERYYQQSENALESYNDLLCETRSSLAYQKYAKLTDDDVFSRLDAISDWQLAKPVMRRWIMAIPEVRDRVRKGHLEGYADLYTDKTPFLSSTDHLDYRLATEGDINFTDDGWEAETVWDVQAGDKLTYSEKCEWRSMRKSIVESLMDPDVDDDPTSPWGSTKLC